MQAMRSPPCSRETHLDCSSPSPTSTPLRWRGVCEIALAHTIESKVEAAYRRGDRLEKRRAMMASWAAFVTAMPAKVVPIRAGARHLHGHR
jgi:hypothetical protein